MDAFWRLSKKMLHDRGMLIAAALFALVSAGGLAVGLAALSPVMKIMGDESHNESLHTLAEQYNAGEPALALPAGFVAALPTEPYASILWIIAALGVMVVFGAVSNFLHQYLSMAVAIKAVARIRAEAFRHVMYMPLGRIVERGPAEYVARIVRDSTELERGFRTLTSKSIAHLTKGLFALIVAILFSWQVAITAPIIGVILWIVLRKLGKQIRRGKRASLAAQQDLLRISTESVQGLRAIKANTAERFASWRFHQENKQSLLQELRVRTARALSGPLAETIGAVMIGAIVIIFARQILFGDLGFEQVVVALASLGVAVASFKPLASMLNELYAAAAPAQRMCSIIDEPRESERDTARRAMPRHQRSIVFDHVSYTYPGSATPAVHDVALHIRHGERIAIVGPNGSGKTTLLSMAPRLLRPQTGRVLIDDVDIESVSLKALRRQIGVVTQETVLFRGTIAENIGIGAGAATREQIIEAARRAHAHDFIMNLPNGYDTDVVEQGASLSGGQRQRLTIARAIIRDPSILILDEATSQIDAESERHITEALEEFCHGRTALLIAHRMSTVVNADRIVVMDGGAVIDQGAHEELLTRCALYQRLCHTQFVDAQ